MHRMQRVPCDGCTHTSTNTGSRAWSDIHTCRHKGIHFCLACVAPYYVIQGTAPVWPCCCLVLYVVWLPLIILSTASCLHSAFEAWCHNCRSMAQAQDSTCKVPVLQAAAPATMTVPAMAAVLAVAATLQYSGCADISRWAVVWNGSL